MSSDIVFADQKCSGNFKSYSNISIMCSVILIEYLLLRTLLRSLMLTAPMMIVIYVHWCYVRFPDSRPSRPAVTYGYYLLSYEVSWIRAASQKYRGCLRYRCLLHLPACGIDPSSVTSQSLLKIWSFNIESAALRSVRKDVCFTTRRCSSTEACRRPHYSPPDTSARN